MRTILSSILIIISLGTLAQKEYQIKMFIDEHPNAKVVLAEIYGESFKNVDTLFTDEDGNGIFHLSDMNNAGMYRVFFDRNSFADLIFNHEDIEFRTEYLHPMDSMEIVSSAENKTYYQFLRDDQQYQIKLELLNPLTTYYPRDDELYPQLVDKFQKLQEEREAYIQTIIKKNPEAFVSTVISFMRSPVIPHDLSENEKHRFMQVHFFDKVDFNNPDILRTDILPTKLINYLSLFSNRNFTQKQLEDSFKEAIDMLMARNFENQLVKEFVIKYLVGGFEKYGFESVIVHIAENYQDETACENEERKSDLQTRLENFKKLAIGKTGPEISIKDVDGIEIKLSEIPSDYVMLIFWASWCPHCTEWLPEIKTLYDAQKKKKIEVLAISLDEELNEWKAYLDKHNFSWINASELKGWRSRSAVDYNIYATPTIVLLDKERKILSKPLTMTEIQKEFESRR